jgi:hypothetical protein
MANIIDTITNGSIRVGGPFALPEAKRIVTAMLKGDIKNPFEQESAEKQALTEPAEPTTRYGRLAFYLLDSRSQGNLTEYLAAHPGYKPEALPDGTFRAAKEFCPPDQPDRLMLGVYRIESDGSFYFDGYAIVFKEPAVSGLAVRAARVGDARLSGYPRIQAVLGDYKEADGSLRSVAAILKSLARDHGGEFLALACDNRVVGSATVTDAILDGKIIFRGQFSRAGVIKFIEQFNLK